MLVVRRQSDPDVVRPGCNLTASGTSAEVQLLYMWAPVVNVYTAMYIIIVNRYAGSRIMV